MIMNRVLGALFIACVLAGPLGAQTTAVVSDARIITETDGHTDTAVVHTIRAGKRYRMEIQGRAPNTIDPFMGGSGNVILMTVSDSAMTMDFLNAATKTYIEFDPLSIIRATREMMKAMGAEMKFERVGDTVTVDSLGGGGLVMGYPTLHFRVFTAFHSKITIMGETSPMNMRQTMDIYVSPQLKKEWGGEEISAFFAGDPNSGMLAGVSDAMPMGTGMDSAFAKVAVMQKRIGAVGGTLKTAVESSSATMVMATKQRQTTEVLKIEKMIVPDSIFSIPGDYKKTEPMLRRPQGDLRPQ